MALSRKGCPRTGRLTKQLAFRGVAGLLNEISPTRGGPTPSVFPPSEFGLEKTSGNLGISPGVEDQAPMFGFFPL